MHSRFATIAAALTLALVTTACATHVPLTSSPAPAAAPAPAAPMQAAPAPAPAMAAPVSTPGDSSLPDFPGRDVVTATCTQCHGTSEFASRRQTRAEWSSTVDDMMGRGASVSEKDYPVIVEYLGAHLGR